MSWAMPDIHCGRMRPPFGGVVCPFLSHVIHAYAPIAARAYQHETECIGIAPIRNISVLARGGKSREGTAKHGDVVAQGQHSCRD